jgi:hypothetical protein
MTVRELRELLHQIQDDNAELHLVSAGLLGAEEPRGFTLTLAEDIGEAATLELELD